MAGAYLDGDYLCRELDCGMQGGNTCPQLCNFSRFSGQYLVNLSVIVEEAVPIACPMGRWCDGRTRRVCPAGVNGNETGFSSERCGGICPRGFFCARARRCRSPAAGSARGV